MDANTPPEYTPTRRYLRDEPALEDKFGAHKRIAKGMANAIRTNPDLKVVGLIGPWGSGKSTVVGFLEPELRAEVGIDRKRVGSGKSVSVRVDLGGGRILKKKKKTAR